MSDGHTSRFAQLQAWAPALLVGLVPLAVLPGAFAPFHVGKWFLVLVLVPAGLAGCAATGRLRWPRRNWFLAWLGVLTLATLLGVAPWMSVAGSPQRNAGLLAAMVGTGAFVLGASVGVHPLVQRVVLRTAFVAGGVVGVLGILEVLGVDLFGMEDLDEVSRLRSSWGSATFAGAHLVVVLPLAVAHLRSQDRRWRAVAIASCVTMGIALLLTGTRGAWLGAIVAAAVLVPAWRPSIRAAASASDPADGRSTQGGTSGDRERGAGVAWTKAALGVVALAAVLVVALPALQRSSGVGRLDQWRTSIGVVADRPVLGSGPDTQRVVLPSGIDESFERDHGSEELHDRVHNVALDTLVTTGGLGLVSLVALGVVLGRDVVVGLRRRLVPTALAAGLAGYVVTLLFAFGDPVLDPLVWLLAGLLLTGIGAESEDPAPASGATDGTPLAPIGRRAAVVAVPFVAVALAGAVWAGGEVIAEHRLAAAMDARAGGDLEGALESLERAASASPGRFDLHQVAARVLTTSLTTGVPGTPDPDRVDEMIESALDGLERARRVAGEDPEVMMDRAELLSAADRPADALEQYESILEVYPHSFRAHLGLGLAAVQLEQLDRAERAWTTAADLAPADARAASNLGLLHEQTGDPDAALEWYERALAIDPEDAAATAGVARVQPPSG